MFFHVMNDYNVIKYLFMNYRYVIADKTIKIWDAFSGNLKATLEGHSNDVCSVAISNDGSSIISGSCKLLIIKLLSLYPS